MKRESIRGGVKREFFQLLVEELFNPLYVSFFRLIILIHTQTTTGMVCGSETKNQVRTGLLHNELMSSSDDLNNYFLTGIALGLCVYNGVLLDIDFPNILYKKLLSEPIGLPDLKDLMPSEYDGLMKLLQYDKDDTRTCFA